MDLKELLYNGLGEEKPIAGSLLIAEPIMDDTIFSRSVILIVDSLEDGSHAGLVMNKRIDITLNRLISGINPDLDISPYQGGPVEIEKCSVIHTLGNMLGNCYEIIPGLYAGADIDKLTDYYNSGEPIEGKVRFFMGYSGWQPGQLEAEIKRKSWAVNSLPDIDSLLKGEGLSYWQKEVKNLGDSFRSWLMVPPHPSCN